MQTTSELTKKGIEHTISETAPSIATNGTSTHLDDLDELDASKLTFTRNSNPQEVPEPNSPEVWAQNYCTDHMITWYVDTFRSYSSPIREA